MPLSLSQKIQEDVKDAMRARDALTLGTLRMLMADVKNAEKEKQARGEAPALVDDEVIELVARGVKRRNDASELYLKGGREDLAKKEVAEVLVLRAYLPPLASHEEIKKFIDGLVASGNREKGTLMRETAKAFKGRADNKEILAMIGEKLQIC